MSSDRRAVAGVARRGRFALAGWRTVVALVALATAVGATSPARAAEPPPAGTRTLILVRHGAYDEDDPRDAEVGRGLTELGRRQADLAAKRLAALPGGVDRVWTSPLTRARETAAIIGRRLKQQPVIDRDLAECTPPSSRADILATLDPLEADSCASQLERAWSRHARPSPAADSVEVLVCHGNVMRWFVVRALGVDLRSWAGMMAIHAGITVIKVRPDGATRVVAYDDAGHLPVEMQTTGGATRLWPEPAKER
jgi:serine/threonine-protein phosphatase PGAM5